MATDIPPQVQNQLRQYQETQQQLQNVMVQRQQVEVQVKELERTVDALGDLSEGTPVYRSVGSVLVGVDDPAALRETLNDQKETLEVRFKSMDRQEKGLRERLQSIQKTLEGMLGQGPGAG